MAQGGLHSNNPKHSRTAAGFNPNGNTVTMMHELANMGIGPAKSGK